MELAGPSFFDPCHANSALRGVSILLSKTTSFKPLEVISDKECRYKIVLGLLCNKKTVLANIYSPNTGQAKFFDKFECSLIKVLVHSNINWCGF